MTDYPNDMIDINAAENCSPKKTAPFLIFVILAYQNLTQAYLRLLAGTQTQNVII